MTFFNQISNNPYLMAEFAIILLVIIIQIVIFIKTSSDARILKNIFKIPLRTKGIYWNDSSIHNNIEDADIDNSLLLVTNSKNEVNLRIKESINNYLINNRGGTINYNIIKDIIDREIDAKDAEVTQSIPIPLYLGLAATIVGIIFGLFAMPAFSGAGAAAGAGIIGIDELINGVKIAMVASLSGLVWTILLSSLVYNKASKNVLINKNLQLNYLQEQLLPALFKEEDAGVIGLKTSIDNFSRLMSRTVDDLREITVNSESNIRAQQETLDRVEKLNITKISKVNLELFAQLDKNMNSFYKFSEFIDHLSEISQNLGKFADKAGNIDKVVNEIDATLNESRALTRFLTSHLEKIETMGDVALYSFDISEKRFKDAVDKLVESTSSNIDSVKKVSDEIEHNFNQVYGQLFNKLDDIAKLHVDKFTEAYSNSLPKFQNLDHLRELETIKLQLSAAFNGVSANGEGADGKLNNLEIAIHRLDQITALLNKLEQNTKALKNYSGSKRFSTPQWIVSLMDWIKKVFRTL